MEEIWKPVVLLDSDMPYKYADRYQVSNKGRVKSVYDGCHCVCRDIVLKQRTEKAGYKSVGLWLDGECRRIKVHRLVGFVFVDGWSIERNVINHKDEDKSNNRVDNLEWCTAKYNTNYGTARQRTTKKQQNDPNQSKRVYQYTISGEFVAEYPSIREAVRQTGINRVGISRCCLGKRNYNSAGNYRWSYDPPTPSTTRSLW